MPWKGEKDPYRIWLSEIILQQTRVDQGLSYYNRFIKKFPTVKKLAIADEKVVFKLWEGLGYYSRCKNLISTAKFIHAALNGKFPSDYESILTLKGIGPYTAAAIASFAFDLPYAVVDGNVIRVLARFFGIKTSPGSSEGKKVFISLANKLLEKRQPGVYNQAIMDFGATVCKPQLPLCAQCVLAADCIAYKKDAVNEYPARSKMIPKKHRWFYYIIAEHAGNFFTRKRIEKDIWQNLFEFILVEPGKELSAAAVMVLPAFKKIGGKNVEIVNVSKIYKQQLTHQTIHGFFIYIKIKKAGILSGYQLVKKQDLLKMAFPRFITGYFADNTGFYGTKS